MIVQLRFKESNHISELDLDIEGEPVVVEFFIKAIRKDVVELSEALGKYYYEV